VDVVAIRQLTAAQQVLSHGLPISNDELLGQRHNVPMLRAPDGYTLHRLIHDARRALARAAGGQASVVEEREVQRA
jgi:hypothetical protein